VTLGDERGQTVTEYLMISGLMTAVAIAILRYTYGPFERILQALVDRIINDPLL
jgi:Flp pilus assembly pilin Flp